jgi:hypothetical protein
LWRISHSSFVLWETESFFCFQSQTVNLFDHVLFHRWIANILHTYMKYFCFFLNKEM